jgi:hypothetical protein
VDTDPRKIDKSKWGPGPWQSEPDRIEWRYRGVPCLMVRQPSAGHWCGYVAVEPGHPWHGLNYSDFDAEVHGGLTYSEKRAGRICHVPQPGEPDDVWWLGFDCAHLGDLSPGYVRWHNTTETYKTAGYVKDETERLADQLVEKRSR